jgi:hypothetical protein
MRRAEKYLQEQEAYRRFSAHVRAAEIMDLVNAPVEERIALSRTIHVYNGTPAQAEGYQAALERVAALCGDTERRWEAGARPGPAPDESERTDWSRQ